MIGLWLIDQSWLRRVHKPNRDREKLSRVESPSQVNKEMPPLSVGGHVS